MNTTTGRLHIFLGMCPGVGKTYAMLQAAKQRASEGVDVLVGVVETHGRSETAALIAGLEVLPKKALEHREHTLDEFDLDAVIARQPALVLVDELAHTNAPGSRHAKRWQDVLELLDAGIDVYSTLNVQHIESQVDTVRQITGVTISETVPDSILDRAQEIQLIDLPVDKLLARLAEGKVYLGERAQAAANHFFKESNLTALREMSLRFTAEQVDRDLEGMRRSKRVSSPWKTNARLLVGVGPSPYAESLIRWTRRAAMRLGCPWIVAWVESSNGLSAEEQRRLTQSLSLARKLGAEVVSVTGDDVSAALLQLALERNVTQLVVGKPERRSWFTRTLADELIAKSGDIDVCVVRPAFGSTKTTANPTPTDSVSLVGEYSWALTLTFVLVSVCWALLPVTGYIFAALVMLLGIVFSALWLSRAPVLVMATLSALLWNYFFIPPQFTFAISKAEDAILFGMFFIVALSMGHLTSRLRQREIAERRRQRQTAALLRVTQSAALSAEQDKGLGDALRTINEVLNADTALIVRNNNRTLPKQAHAASTFTPSKKEWGVIEWSYANKQSAGRFTDTLPQSEAAWFPLQTATSLMGVLGVRLTSHATMDFSMRQTVEAFALQLALVLEKEHFIAAVSRAEVVEQSDRLRRTLLDSVSHELKTPIAVIRMAAESQGPSATREEIMMATQRLQRVVDGFLSMTQLDSEVVRPQLDWCDVRDVIEAAREGLPVEMHLPADLPLIHTDHRLLAQALANVLHNAAVHGRGPIEVSASCSDVMKISVRDHGAGLPAGEELRVFDKFHRAAGAPAGGTGLGLAIASGMMRALGGEITARNHPEGGAVFELRVNLARP